MQICEFDMCTGCSACSCVCPHGCISMAQDSDGFRRPSIDEEKCVSCGLCQRVCPANKHERIGADSYKQIRPYAYIHPNETILKESSSGGAFTAFAESIISRGGTVFGASYDDNFHVVHVGVSSMHDLNRLRGSKYVESEMQDCYAQAKCCLDDGRAVLFTGTPCQIAGLYASLHYKKYKNLYTMELLCHGVPSATVFNKYLLWLQKKKGQLTSYSFRDKSKWGWGNWGSYTYVTGHTGKNKKVLFPVASDYFYSLYFKGNNFRESCYKCPYASLVRVADITVGDFWGIEKVRPDISSRGGVSVITVNTDQGGRLFEKSKCAERAVKVELNDVILYNPTIISATNRPQSRDEFYRQFKELGFQRTAKLYCKIHCFMPVVLRYIPTKWKEKIKSIIK